MKEIILYRDYSDNQFVRDFMIFKQEKEDDDWMLYIIRTEFGVITNASKTKIADNITTFNTCVNLIKNGFDYLSEAEIEQIDKDKFYI